MDDFVYVLIVDDVCNDTNSQSVYVFNNREQANNKVVELKERFEKETQENLTIEDETSDDELLKYYNAYENGNYNNNHFCLTIYQREIE